MTVAPLWHVHIINRRFPQERNDLIGRWYGVRAALQGVDPYTAEMTKKIQDIAGHDDTAAFDYPGMLVTEMAPVAWMSWPAIRMTFLVAMVLGLVVGFGMSARMMSPQLRGGALALAVWLGLCSWPAIWGLRMQQLTLPAAMLVLAACALLQRDRGVAAGVLLALATMKPQLAAPLLVWLAVWVCTRRAWRVAVSFAVSMTALLIATEALMPGWLPHWLAAIHQHRDKYGVFPLQLIFGHWVGLAGTLLLLGWAAVWLWRLRGSAAGTREFGLAVALVLAVTVSADPTRLPMIYNQVLLFPACVALALEKPPRGGYAALVHRGALLLLAWGYAAVMIAAVVETVWRPTLSWDIFAFLNPELPVVVVLFLLNTLHRREQARIGPRGAAISAAASA